MYALKKLIKLHQAAMMIKDYRLMVEIQHILMDTTKERVYKKRC